MRTPLHSLNRRAAGCFILVMMQPALLWATPAKSAAAKPAPAKAAPAKPWTPASRALCAHLTKANDIHLCRDACQTWPASRTCLVARRFGDLGMAVLVHAVKHKRSVVQVAAEAKMPAKEGRALMLWADAAGFRPAPWGPQAPLDDAARADVQRARTLKNQGIIAYKAGRPSEALTQLRQAVTLFRRHLPATDPRRFDAEGISAYVLIRMRRFQAAKTVLDRWLSQQRAVYGRDHPKVADTLQLLGQVAVNQGRLTEARELFRTAMAIATPVWGADHPKLRVLWNNLAMTLSRLGDSAGCERAYRESLRIARRVQGPQHLDTATDLTNLGVLLSERARLAEAERLLLQGIVIRKAHKASHIDMAGSYHNLGAIKQLTGELAGARRYLERALAEWEQAYDPGGIRRSSTLLLLGQVLQAMGDYQGAMIAYRKCKDLRERGLKRGAPETMRVYMQLGQLLDHLAGQAPAGPERGKLLQQAEQLLRLAYDQTRRVLGAEHADTLRRLAALAGHLTTAGQPKKAAKLLRQVVAGLGKRLGADHPQVAAARNNLGVALAASGQHEAALRTYRAAERDLVARLGGWHPDTQSVRVNIARMLLQLGKVKQATRAIDGASAQLLGHLNASAASASSDMALLMQVANLGSLFNAAISAHVAGGDPAGGFDQSLRWQGAGTRLETLWRQLRRASAGASAKGKALLQRYQAAQLALLQAQGGAPRVRKAGAAPAKATAKADPRRRAAAKRIRALSKEVARLERQLSAAVPALAGRNQQLQPTVAKVCRALKGRRSSLVDYVSFVRLPVGERRYGAYVVTPRGCRVRWVDLGARGHVDGLVKAWRSALKTATQCYVRRHKARFCRRPFRALDVAGEALRRQLWAPVAAHLGKTQRTWIVPTGALTGVAFDALPDAQGRYLIEARTLGYLPFPAAAMGLGKRAGRRPARRQAAGGALVLGDLDYQGAVASARAALRQWQPCTAAGCVSATAPAARSAQTQLAAFSRTSAATRGADGGAAVCGRAASWSALPATEAPTVARLLAKRVGKRVWLASGQSASEPALRAALPNHRFLHLATHGFFSDPVACGEPVAQARIDKLLQGSVAQGAAQLLIDPMAMSGVVLSGANGFDKGAAPANDGILSAREVARMDLRGTELAVLSACETGLGFSGEGEGTLGLSRAFLLAGAAHTVVSLWQVPSRETAALFERFYADLIGGAHRGDVIGSLRAARLGLLKELRGRKIKASAFLWGAFLPVAGGR